MLIITTIFCFNLFYLQVEFLGMSGKYQMFGHKLNKMSSFHTPGLEVVGCGRGKKLYPAELCE